MWDLPGPGIKPMSPALAGGFLHYWATRETTSLGVDHSPREGWVDVPYCPLTLPSCYHLLCLLCETVNSGAVCIHFRDTLQSTWWSVYVRGFLMIPKRVYNSSIIYKKIKISALYWDLILSWHGYCNTKILKQLLFADGYTAMPFSSNELRTSHRAVEMNFFWHLVAEEEPRMDVEVICSAVAGKEGIRVLHARIGAGYWFARGATQIFDLSFGLGWKL